MSCPSATRRAKHVAAPSRSSFVVHQGHAYGFDGRIMAAIDLDTGERVWKGGRYGAGQVLLPPDQDLLLGLAERDKGNVPCWSSRSLP